MKYVKIDSYARLYKNFNNNRKPDNFYYNDVIYYNINNKL